MLHGLTGYSMCARVSVNGWPCDRLATYRWCSQLMQDKTNIDPKAYKTAFLYLEINT